MAYRELELEYDAQAVAISPDNRKVAILYKENIKVFSFESKEAKGKPSFDYHATAMIDLHLGPNERAEQICFMEQDNFHVLVRDLASGQTSLYDHAKGVALNLPNSPSSPFFRIFTSVDHSNLYCATSSGIVQIVEGAHGLDHKSLCAIPSTTPWSAVVRIGEDVSVQL